MDVFLFPFQSSRVTSDPVVYTDFNQTLQWHESRAKLKLPFVQKLSIIKTEVDGKVLYKFLSGNLQPVLDGSR